MHDFTGRCCAGCPLLGGEELPSWLLPHFMTALRQRFLRAVDGDARRKFFQELVGVDNPSVGAVVIGNLALLLRRRLSFLRLPTAAGVSFRWWHQMNNLRAGSSLGDDASLDHHR